MQQFLYGDLRGGIRNGLRFLRQLELNHQPIGLRHPLNAGARSLFAAGQIEFHLVLTAFDIGENALGIHLQKVGEQIQTIDVAHLQRIQAFSGAGIDEQESSAALGNQQGFVQRVEQPGDHEKRHIGGTLRLGHR